MIMNLLGASQVQGAGADPGRYDSRAHPSPSSLRALSVPDVSPRPWRRLVEALASVAGSRNSRRNGAQQPPARHGCDCVQVDGTTS